LYAAKLEISGEKVWKSDGLFASIILYYQSFCMQQMKGDSSIRAAMYSATVE